MGGYDGRYLKSVEMTQLNGQNNASCLIINDLPNEVAGQAVDTKIGPIVCGGRTNSGTTHDCLRLSSNGSWSKFPNLNVARWLFSMTEVSDLLVSIGGVGADTSFEIINVQNGTNWVKKELPFKIHGHCSTKINQTTILITGGYLDGKVSKKFKVNIIQKIYSYDLKSLIL